jgi:hypothetical protein
MKACCEADCNPGHDGDIEREAVRHQSSHRQRGRHARKGENASNRQIDAARDDRERLAERDCQHPGRIEARGLEIRLRIEILTDKGEDEKDQR